MTKCAANDVVEMIAAGDEIETSVLVKQGSNCGEARITFSAKDCVVSIKWRETASNTSFPARDIASAFALLEKSQTDVHLLINTLSAQKKQGYGFAPVGERLHAALRSAWEETFHGRIVETRTSDDHRTLITDLEKLVQKFDRCVSTVWMSEQGLLREVEFSYFRENSAADIYIKKSPVSNTGFYFRGLSISSVLEAAIHLTANGQYHIDSTMVKINNAETGPAGEFLSTDDQFYKLAAAVWSIVGNKDFAASEGEKNPAEVRKRLWQSELESSLTAGENGVRWWNELTNDDRNVCSFAKLKLQNCVLSGLMIGPQNFQECNFDGSTMKEIEATLTDLSRSSFRNVNLSGSKFVEANAEGADFSNASLKKVKFQKACLRNAVFANCDLSSVDFKGSDLRGADFSACTLPTDARKFTKAYYDGFTRFPAGFSPEGCLQWRGSGPDPYKLRLMKGVKSNAVTFVDFLSLIQIDFDSNRVGKALTMLKQDRFSLYVEQNDSGVFGVIKSQTDAELIYACKLGNEGTFCCCTQNLNPCGGLRGSLCKHILCMVIGLTKSGKVNPNTATRCIIASKKESPLLDPDLMGGLFIKFAGALSGEIDWRPTETIPEDYYDF